MRFPFPILMLILLSTTCLIAQRGSITGRVMGGNEPLDYATVAVIELSDGTLTIDDGTYSLDVPAGEYTLRASFLGYKPVQKKVVVGASGMVTLNFSLEPTAGSLSEVVVTGTLKEVSRLDSPVPVEVYTDDFFRANPTPSVFESLQNVNGVRPQLNCNVCNTGDIHINGLEGPYTMVLLDGMPIVSGLSTVYGLTGIPQSLIQRIEVVKGPASTLYGSEAVGGLINIITKDPLDAPRFSVDAFTTSWGEVNTDLGLSYRPVQNVNGLLGVNYFNYSHPIDNNGDGFTDLTLQDRISVFNKFSVERASGKELSLAGRYVYEDRWGGEMNWTPAFRGGEEVYGESIYTSRWEAIGNYELPMDTDLDFQFSANGHRQNSVYGNTIYLADQRVYFGQLLQRQTIGNHDLLLGAAYRYTYYDDNTPATANFTGEGNEPSRIHLPGAFVQDQIQVTDAHRLLLGLRYDYNSRHGGILTPRLNYQWTPDDRQTLRVSGGNGYRVANVFTEDHAALTGARTVVFDRELQPETSWNGNVNYVRHFFPSDNFFWKLDATAFYTYFTNRILPDYETDPNQIIYANLAGHSVSRGVSLNVDLSWLSGLTVLAGATVMDVSVVEDGERTRQLLTESVQGVWRVGYTLPRWGLRLDYTGNLYGPMRLPLLGELDERPAYSPWWSIQNVQLSRDFGDRWEIYGGVKNLLNYTPPANSIARAFDPFDRGVTFDGEGQVIPTADNPQALTFDPTYVFAPNQGVRGFLGVRYRIE